MSRTTGFAVLILLGFYISYVSGLRYFIGAEPGPPPVVANAFASPWLVIHVIGATVALVVGPFQFVAAIRARWPRFHRLTGYSYVTACAVGAPAGLLLSFGTTAGPIAGAGFAALGLLTIVFTWLGLRAAIARKFDEHREWMIRSYALTAAAITLRLMIPASFILGLDFFAAYRVIAWACWLTNLALVESYIRWTRPAARRFARLAPA
ncbi:MAG TPA: DUF2306 domain-containing protein [Sphingomicrobium sp.]|nr:DUF2306 domain-containing protein [Sphingomicrobium sp.]